MPPKAKKSDALPPPPPEPNPEEQLPQDIRDLSKAPFPVDWHAVVSIVQLQAPDIAAEPLKATLKKKELVRVLAVSDLILRLDPASQLAADIRAAQDAHLAAGGQSETFVPTSEQVSQVLQERFARDQRIDWKLELQRRRTALQVYQDEVKASKENLAAANEKLAAAEAKLAAWQERQAAARAAAEEEGTADADEEEGDAAERELSREEEEQQAALQNLQAAEQRAVHAGENLASAMVTMEQRYVSYQAYWVDGIGSTAEAVEAVAEQGIPVRAIMWGHTAPPAPQEAAANGDATAPPAAAPPPAAPAAPAAAADGGSTQPAAAGADGAAGQAAPPAAPELFCALQAAAGEATWESKLGAIVALDIELPASPPPAAPADEDTKKKPAAAASAKAKKAVEEPAAPLVAPDAAGWDLLTDLFIKLNSRVQEYDEWRARVKVYDAGEAPEPPSMDYYGSILEGVAPERISIPVMMHAMLEQVSRNVQGSEVVEEEDSTVASAWALEVLDRAFKVFEAAEQGIFAPEMLEPVDYALVQQGDDLAAAAAGLTVGHAHGALPPTSSTNKRALSPTSTLEGPLASSTANEAADEAGAGAGPGADADAAEAAACVGVEVQQDGNRGPSLVHSFVPGGMLDVDTVEQHMLQLLQVPGVGGFGVPATEMQDAISKALKESSIKAHIGDIPLATVHRYQLLQAAADLLPPSAKLAHEGEVLGRHHTEQLLPGVLRQTLVKAQLEMPHMAVGYYPKEDAALVAYFAGTYEQQQATHLPIAWTFASYWQHAAAAEQPLELPHKAYKVAPKLQEAAASGRPTRYQFTDEGYIISTGPTVPFSFTKGPTTVLYSTTSQAQLIATLDDGVTLSAYRSLPAPPEVQEAVAEAVVALPAAADPDTEAAAQSQTATPDGGKGKAKPQPAAAPAAPAAAAAAAAGAKGPPQSPPKTPPGGKRGVAEVPLEAAAPEPEAEPPLPPAPEPEPVVAIQVVTAQGTIVEMNTEGLVLIAPRQDASKQLPPARGVEVHGAPIAPGNLEKLAPQATMLHAVTPSGALISKSADGRLCILHPDGAVSERLPCVDKWVTPEGRDAKGWLRTLAEGTRYSEPDSDSKPRPPPPPPPPPPPEPEVEDPKAKKGKASAKGRGKEEREPEAPPPAPPPPPSPPPPFQVELPPMKAVEVTDPETQSRVLIREDLTMRIIYPTGDTLLQDAEGTRISHAADGAWSVDFDELPAVSGNGSQITVTAAPGLTLTWNSSTKCVVASLPDGSCITAMQPFAAFVPAGRSLSADLLAFTAQGVGSDGAVDAKTLAQAPPCHGVAFFDVFNGAAAFFASEEVFFEKAGGSKDRVQAWPEAGPLVWVEQPPQPEPVAEPEVEQQPLVSDEEESYDEDDENQPSNKLVVDGAGDAATANDDESAQGASTSAAATPLPPLPPPEPITHINPVAKTVVPRIFVVYKSGDGYEILSGRAVESFTSRAATLAAACTKETNASAAAYPEIGVPMIQEQPMPGCREPGVFTRSCLTALAPTTRQPLPIGITSWAQRYDPHAEELMPVLKRTATLMAGRPGEPCKGQYIPRIVGYEPPAVHAPKPLPVLLYREVIQYPQLGCELIKKMRAVLAEEEAAAAVATEQLQTAVPFTDERPEEEQACDAEVLDRILEMRKAREGRSRTASREVRRRRTILESEEQRYRQDSAAAAAAAAAAAEKDKRPWPPKIGPFDGTPKRPSEGVLKYWDAEEGLVAKDSDPYLADTAPKLNRRTLPPRLPPAHCATPGLTSSLTPGVYLSDRAWGAAAGKVDASHDAAAATAAAAGYDGMLQPYPAFGSNQAGLGFQSSGYSSPKTTGRRGGGTQGSHGGIDYAYPELGHTAILQHQSPQAVAYLSAKQPQHDVYGQPRLVPPPLPKIYKQGEADIILNSHHIESEGEVLHINKTASASLLRMAGKASKQFALTPGHLHFGNVPVSSIAHLPARLRNVSTSVARFSVMRPELPLRVIFKPGPLAPGMETILTVELVADRVGDFVGEIVVKSELNILTLTVSAKIVEAEAGDDNGSPEMLTRAPGSRGALGVGLLPPILEAAGGKMAAMASAAAGQRPSQGSPMSLKPGTPAALAKATAASSQAALDMPMLDETKTLQELLGVAAVGQVVGEAQPAVVVGAELAAVAEEQSTGSPVGAESSGVQ